MSAKFLLEQTIKKIDGAYAPSTIRAYQTDFLNFIEFCKIYKECALPASPDIIVLYLAHLTDTKRSSASIRRAIAGIASIHTLNDYENPTQNSLVKIGLKRMYRQLGRFRKQAEGITRELLDEMLATTDTSLRGLRNHAMLLVAYDTLCRRSELVAMNVEDISHQIVDRKKGILTTSIFISQSKTDQEGHGRWLPISIEAAQALNKWLTNSAIKSGLIFRGINRGNSLTQKLDPGQISRIYKKIATTAKLDKTIVSNISGHSMRVGAAQDLVLSGASLPMIMCRGRWSKADTVMRYVEKVGFQFNL